MNLTRYNKAGVAALVPIFVELLATIVPLTSTQQNLTIALLSGILVLFIPNFDSKADAGGAGKVGGLLVAVLASGLALAACSGVPKPQSPAQAVYALQGGYTAALATALEYKKLPACTAEPRPERLARAAASYICSEPAVVARLQQADDVAWTAIKAAQDTVRDPRADGGRLALALVAAEKAVQAFAAISTTLRIR